MHLCQEGHLVVPTPLFPPIADTDNYRHENKIRMTLLEAEKNKTNAKGREHD